MRRIKLLVFYLTLTFVLVGALDNDYDEDILNPSNDTVTNDELYPVIAARLNCSELVIRHKGIKVEATNSTSIIKTVERVAPRGQKRIKTEGEHRGNSLTHTDENVYTLPPEIFGGLPENYTELPLTAFTDADYYSLPFEFPNDTAEFDFAQLNTSEYDQPLDFASFNGQADLNLGTSNSQPELNLPTSNSKPDLNLATSNSQPEMNLPTSNSQPKQNLPTSNSQPKLNLSTSTSQPQVNLPTSNSQPKLNLSTFNSQPKLNLSTSTSQPQVNLPTSNSQPKLNLSTFNSQSKLNLSTSTSQPEMNLPTSNNQPKLNLPTFNSRPKLNLPTFNSRPKLNLPTFNSRPKLNLPTFNSQPVLNLLTLNNQRKPNLRTEHKQENGTERAATLNNQRELNLTTEQKKANGTKSAATLNNQRELLNLTAEHKRDNRTKSVATLNNQSKLNLTTEHKRDNGTKSAPTLNNQPQPNLTTEHKRDNGSKSAATLNNQRHLNLTTEHKQDNGTGSTANKTTGIVDRVVSSESSGLDKPKAVNNSETVVKEIPECSYAFDNNGSVVNWYQVFIENGGLPGEVNATRLTPNKTRVLEPCHRPVTNTAPPLKDLVYEHEVIEFENLYRREKAFLRFAGTSSEFLDIRGQMVWAPFKGEPRYFRLSYRKDDTGFYVNVRRRHKCVFEKNPLGVKCHPVKDFVPCEKITGTRTLSPGLQASLIG